MTTNEEPTNNYQPITKSKIDWIGHYNLQYDKTHWGMFYEVYKDLGQLQLQKALEQNKNEMDGMIRMDKHTRTKYTQHLFYETEWDEKLRKFKTPDVLLRHTKHGLNDPKWCIEYRDYQDKNLKIFLGYYKRCRAEHLEVKEFYENKKKELEIEQKEAHKEHANEKVKCPFCQADFSRTNMARHKKTNKKCLEIQSLEK